MNVNVWWWRRRRSLCVCVCGRWRLAPGKCLEFRLTRGRIGIVHEVENDHVVRDIHRVSGSSRVGLRRIGTSSPGTRRCWLLLRLTFSSLPLLLSPIATRHATHWSRNPRNVGQAVGIDIEAACGARCSMGPSEPREEAVGVEDVRAGKRDDLGVCLRAS